MSAESGGAVKAPAGGLGRVENAVSPSASSVETSASSSGCCSCSCCSGSSPGKRFARDRRYSALEEDGARRANSSAYRGDNRFPRDVEFGVHRPCCGGRCLRAHTGADNFLPLTVFLIAAPCGAYFSLLAEQQAQRVSLALPIVVGVLTLSSIVWLLMAWLTEPGILPTITFEDTSDAARPRVRTHIVVDGMRYELAAFRAKFSRFTDSCIEHFDHYCPWIGNAVGKRNYRWFVFFVTSVLFLSIAMCGTCVTDLVLIYLADESVPLASIVKRNIVSVCLASYAFLLSLSLLGLWFFHMRAVCSNETTNEHLKGVYRNRHNPNDMGGCNNCLNFLCAPCVHRSYVVGSQGANPLLNPLADPAEGHMAVGALASPPLPNGIGQIPELSQSFPDKRGLLSTENGGTRESAVDGDAGIPAEGVDRKLSQSFNAVQPWLSKD